MNGVGSSSKTVGSTSTWFAVDKTNSQPTTYVKSTNCIAFYWTGMEPGRNWLRIDIVRKFCGIPNATSRDIVELSRPIKSFDSNKTFAALTVMANAAPIGGHT